MNRRTLLQGMAAATAALILPPTLDEHVEAARRYWSLDQTMVPGSWLQVPRGNGLWRKDGGLWRVSVIYPDGKQESHLLEAPEDRAKIRLNRSDTIKGATVVQAATGTLLVGYGWFYDLV